MEACFRSLNPYYKNTDECDFDFRGAYDGTLMARIIGCIVRKFSVLEHTKLQEIRSLRWKNLQQSSFVSYDAQLMIEC